MPASRWDMGYGLTRSTRACVHASYHYHMCPRLSWGLLVQRDDGSYPRATFRQSVPFTALPKL